MMKQGASYMHKTCCCCLPTPMTLASGGFRSSPLWSTSQLLRPAGQQCSYSGGICRQIHGWQCVLCMWALQRGHSGDGCALALTLCKYDLRKCDLFVLSWARVRRVRMRSISSELLICGGGVRSILLLPLVARCIETIYVCRRPVQHSSVVYLLKGSRQSPPKVVRCNAWQRRLSHKLQDGINPHEGHDSLCICLNKQQTW